MEQTKAYILLLLFVLSSTISQAQDLLMSVVSFEMEQFDVSARSEQFKKIDGNGDLYAIVKLKSMNPTDDLESYQFNFGNLRHIVEPKGGGEVWVYVQKNAKRVTITRHGYRTISQYDLGYTIEAGRNYLMTLASKEAEVQLQMLRFSILPPHAGAMVAIIGEDGNRKPFGVTDSNGDLAKNLELGTYTYEVLSENYHQTEGRITLNNPDQTHKEVVTMRPNFGTVTLTVHGGSEIYINGECKGTSPWTGKLSEGRYNVECRLKNHVSSSQGISVTEGQQLNLTLTPPTPITGKLSVTPSPVETHLKIDDKDYGTTPCNINDILIGPHTITLSAQGYQDYTSSVEIMEGKLTSISPKLNKNQMTGSPNSNSSPKGAIKGKRTANGHEYVDLGLSVKWATCNIGASHPSDYGDYFAWGETETKSSYTERNCKTRKKSIGDIAGNSGYDAVRTNWGGKWRLPTKEEFEELNEKCIWTWTTLGGHSGYLVKSKTNDNSIFLPASGWCHEAKLGLVGEYGNYWSSTPNESNKLDAYNLYFYSSSYNAGWNNRHYGRSVRGVIETTEDVAYKNEDIKTIDNAIVETPAMYPGAEEALLAFISKNLIYPQNDYKQGVQGTVILRFLVENDGSISNVEVERSLTPNCDQAAIDVVKKLQRFTPARKDGRPVSVWFRLPISFRIQ